MEDEQSNSEENISQIQDNSSKETITKPIESSSPGNKLSKIVPVIFIIVVVAIGIATGFVLSTMNKPTKGGIVLSEDDEISPEIQENLSQTFSDEAQGVLEKNTELDKYAQGPWILNRPGGEDQRAYLTSTVLDLDEFIGKEVIVYGETFGSSQVGWLLDVGKVEVIE